MHEHLIKWLSEIIKKTERGVPLMLAPRRHCPGHSKVYCDIRKRWLLPWNQTYYVLHISYSIYYFRNQYWSSLHLLPLRLMTPT